VPYFDNANVQEFATCSKSYSSALQVQGYALIKGSRETGFRTRAPQGTIVSTVPRNVAEPYSWFLDSYQEIKQRNAVSRGFDAKLFRTDEGHTWDLRKYQFLGDRWSGTTRVGGYPHTFVNADPIAGGFGGWGEPVRDLTSFPALAYGRAAPRTAIFDLGVALGELREGLPRFVPDTMKKDLSKFKAIGSDYLNAQFGWIPFLSMVQDFASALAHASTGFVQPVGPYHRSYAPDGTGSTVISSGDGPASIRVGTLHNPVSLQPALTSFGGSPTSQSGFDPANATWKFTETVSRTLWFEGEFVVLPKIGFDPSSYLDRLDAVMKVDITPATLWELAPWSWLFDWFFHLGESFRTSELALNDRILSTYGYAMERSSIYRKLELSNIRQTSTSRPYTGPTKLTSSWETTSLRRVRANPFGFTLNPTTGLSATQKAILGALGLTRGKL
jgi:hypothetical protein